MSKLSYIYRFAARQGAYMRCFALMALLLMFSLSISAKIYYVSPNGNGDGSSWATASSLNSVLNVVTAGDEIWLLGSEQVSDATIYYTRTGFTLPGGVSMYGGFKGDETQLSQREYGDRLSRMRYRSILAGSKSTFGPGSTADAPHVLTMNLSDKVAHASKINGVMIVGGYADGAGVYGGGVFVTGAGHYIIEHCFFANNYGSLGGAVYVSPESGNYNNNISMINLCEFFNNAAGVRSEMSNSGGGIYLAGKGMVVNCSIYNNEKGGINLSSASSIINSTVVHNTGGAIDAIDKASVVKPIVANTIVWENSYLSHSNSPQFFHCAAKEFTLNDKNGNIKLSDKNNDPNGGPLFITPSSRLGFDRTHDWAKLPYPLWVWEPLYGSPLIDKGDNSRYIIDVSGQKDIENSPRISSGTIDIGSYEFEPIAKERIRFVKVGASGKGTSWADASGDLQKMIDELADNNPSNIAGEVWVAEGEYVPTKTLIETPSYDPRFASFRMRDGINVYGGFNGTESSRSDRAMASSRPWDFAHKTILRGFRTSELQGELQTWHEVGHRWTMNAGKSAHVVWFAHLPSSDGSIAPFKNVTVLDGVTIMGGNGIVGNTPECERFHFGKGAGLFMGVQAELRNSVVHTNVAQLRGGGAYLQGGEIFSSLLYNNGAGAERISGRGGAVYMEGLGIVLRSALVNNAANNGGAIYMERTAAAVPEYMIVSTSLISNNTTSRNGAILCDDGGVVLQSTIVNNYCPMIEDLTDGFASRTGGIYLYRYGWVINSILWNNRFGPSQDSRRVPMYARETTPATARFYNTAASGLNNSIWVDVMQKDMVSMTSANNSQQEGVISPEFDFSQTGTSGITAANVETKVGVQPQWKNIDFFWPLSDGSNLRAMGLELGSFPSEIVLSPQLDLMGAVFDPKPAIGASHVRGTNLNPEKVGNVWRLYVDSECTTSTHDGHSWETGYRSLNEAIDYFHAHSKDADAQGKVFEIYVMEGTIHPKYGFSTIDPRSATIRIPRMWGGQKLLIKGGFSRDAKHVYNPMMYRTIINGNERGVDIKEGHFHNILLLYYADVEIAGFHVINGYADKEATVKRGAGLLMSNNSKVLLRDCVFENNTAVTDAAIGTATDANNTDLTLINCVINNNTNTGDTEINSTPVVTSSVNNIYHSTFVNNWGKASGFTNTANSFSAGNLGNNSVDIPTFGPEAHLHFANPTKERGATLGFKTYYGGYSNFTPLTSSDKASALLINKSDNVVNTTTDLAQFDRTLGGKVDLGAYEASLPAKGSVIYVRTNGDDRNDGSSWDTALASVYTAVRRAKSANADPAKRPQVWVAAGIYSRDAGPDEFSCYQIEDGVNVYGGFPKMGNPGMKDRHPLVSKHISNPKGYKPEDYETILQPLNGWDEKKPVIDLSGQSSDRAYKPKRNRVLAPSGNVPFTVETVWDGFTIQNGWFDCTLLTTPGVDGVGGDGAAGVKLWDNMVIRNSVIRHNKTIFEKDRDGGVGWRAAGVFCSGTNSGGSIINCYLLDNRMNAYDAGRNWFFGWSYYWKEVQNAGTAYGAGAYVFKGTVYNCVIAGNSIEAKHADGAGVFLENATFFNNTIVKNSAVGTTRASGGVAIYQDIKNVQAKNYLDIYNCIIGGNSGNMNPEAGNHNVAVINGGGINVYNSISDVALQDVALDKYVIKINNSYTVQDLPGLFVSYNGVNGRAPDYRLAKFNQAVNKGLNEATDLENRPVVLMDYNDMDFTDRIKDCTVDIGAFERNNSENIAADVNDIFYVTISGSGLANGSSPDNAACRMKLQEVLYKAGELVKLGKKPIVKLAGYTGADLNNDNVYWANTLSDPNDPQSFTYVIPYGVTLMGGFNPNGVATKDGWEDLSRDAYTYRTILSPLTYSEGQIVNGYHAIEFGEKPTDMPANMPELTTVVDGVSLQGGKATSLAGKGSRGTKGGGAIVPSWGHLRNCIVRDNVAIEGGGLYLEPGALVSGCLVVHNRATVGAGIYMKQDVGATAEQGRRSHAISCSFASNIASDNGGGIFLENYSGGVVNSVIGGNKASSGNNISGIVDYVFKDDLLTSVLLEMSKVTGDSPKVDSNFYPFNNCFVEAYKIPGIFQNDVMTRDSSVYVTESFRLRAFSPLINSGPIYSFQTSSEKLANISAYDMQGLSRLDRRDTRTNIDVGAFAYAGGNIPEPKDVSEVVCRIFVSANTSSLIDEKKLAANKSVEDYLGRSFHTSLSHIDDALEYIKKVRALKDPVGATEKFSDVKFEIWVAAGVYKPFMRRMDASHNIVDQRLNSFIVPNGVKIFGGFSGLEDYGYNVPDGKVNLEGGRVVMIDNIPDMVEAVKRLDQRAFIDMNGNKLHEPWELKEQTILSGNINQSSKEKNVYHVVYSYDEAPNPALGGVYLDGLIIQDGETLNRIVIGQNSKEIGFGGGVYSYNVDYTISQCRLLHNRAMRGGAVYVRNAKLKIFSSLIAGNGPTRDLLNSYTSDEPRGGAVYVTSAGGVNGASLYAANNLWANNECAGNGGAIGVSAGTQSFKLDVDIINNSFVRNKAQDYGAIFIGPSVQDVKITNCAFWGNEITTGQHKNINAVQGLVISHSAFDERALRSGAGNIFMNEENMALDGPRFRSPSPIAGMYGFSARSHWNPVAISVLADQGDGKTKINGSSEVGAYKEWWSKVNSDYKNIYVRPSASGDIYKRYAGPLESYTPNGVVNRDPDHIIDIGFYEYQHPMSMNQLDNIFVAPVETGDGSGKDWNNATSNLQAAMSAMTHPKGGKSKDKHIYVKSGEYSASKVADGIAAFYFHGDDTQNDFLNSVTLHGSCTGYGFEQNFSKPTVIRVSDADPTSTILDVENNGFSMTIEGVTLFNDGTLNEQERGMDIYAKGAAPITLKSVAVRNNSESGIYITSDKASTSVVKMANLLFADGAVGLKLDNMAKAEITNATFANNKEDVVYLSTATIGLYNSVSWNDKNNISTDEALGNVAILRSVPNMHVDGPNFVKPESNDLASRDYSIRPSKLLLNKGVVDKYKGVLGLTDIAAERDLGNNLRVKGNIDVGAYEFSSDLKKIIYVKQDVVGSDNSGSSWSNALRDLQSAINLAAIYSSNKSTNSVVDTGFVFVDKGVTSGDIEINMPNVKIYGGMNGETTSLTDVKLIPAALLASRRGLLENDRFSTIASLIISNDALVDGFNVGSAKVDRGVLSTSLVNVNVDGAPDGLLYNSLVYGTVSGCAVVNVTAIKTISSQSCFNSISNAKMLPTSYLSDRYWKYQLKEDDNDINGGKYSIDHYIRLVGHDRDIAGNCRVRGVVDNGAFEAWLVNVNSVVSESDYPHGKSVVYLSSGVELGLDKSLETRYTAISPFNPGFMLLMHGAELLGNGIPVRLSNVALDRDVKANGYDMAFVPYDVDFAKTREFINQNSQSVKIMRYDGNERSKHTYIYSPSDSKAWIEGMPDLYNGVLLDNSLGATPAKVRFYGSNYEENMQAPGDKYIYIKQYNYNNWSDLQEQRFTHKENMGWNLVGSPYLHSMNLSDMEYGRVVYTIDGGNFKTSLGADGFSTGMIGAGCGFLTQTATLQESEVVHVKAPSKSVKPVLTRSGELALAITGLAARVDDSHLYDVVELTAVSSSQASSEFNIESDGVKWMSFDNEIPQIYIERGEGRYSLLSSVDEKSAVELGVRVGSAGDYLVSLPADVSAFDYESVILHDRETGKSVDLKNEAYQFNVAHKGEQSKRFELRLNGTIDDGVEAIRAYKIMAGRIRVVGLLEGSMINVYDLSGHLIATRVATASSEEFILPGHVVIVEVVSCDGERLFSDKVSVR